MIRALFYFKKFDFFFNQVIDTFKSIIAVALFSSIPAAVALKKIAKKQNKKICYILGNGPSLAKDLETNLGKFQKEDVLAVNYFANTSQFSIIKPRYYMFVDPVIFNINGKPSENVELISKLNSITWEMILFIPNSRRKSQTISQLRSPFLKVVFFNSTTVTGFKKLRNFIYKNNLGIPSSRNVSIPAILQIINFNYENVLLFGMDHSWLKTLFVDENNIVHEDDRHFFDLNIQNDREHTDPISRFMLDYHVVFKAHEVLQSYAIKKNVKIINCSKNSFIDAYRRSNHKT